MGFVGEHLSANRSRLKPLNPPPGTHGVKKPRVSVVVVVVLFGPKLTPCSIRFVGSAISIRKKGRYSARRAFSKSEKARSIQLAILVQCDVLVSVRAIS